MPALSRIAVVGRPTPSLLEQLAALPDQPVVRTFADLRGDAAAILAFSPRLLFCCLGATAERDAGALQVLASLLPTLELVLVSDPSRELAARELARSLGAGWLDERAEPAALRALLGAVRGGGAGSSLVALQDLVRGLADELNDPLTVGLGHSQLLQSALPAGADALGAHAAAIRDALRRIGTTVRQLQVLAAGGAAQGPPVPVVEILADALAACQREGKTLTVAGAEQLGAATVRADRRLLSQTLTLLFLAGAELAGPRGGTQARVEVAPEGVAFVILVDRPLIEAHSLRKLFEPYALLQVVRGMRHGLALWVVQAIVQDLAGTASARLLADQILELRVSIPS
jgi:signal transduction histidine kinase